MTDYPTRRRNPVTRRIVRRRRRLSAIGMFILVLAGSLALTLFLRAVHTVAQDGLPTPEGRLGGAMSIATQPPAPPRTPTPTVRRVDVPPASDCDIEPRTIDEILRLVPSRRPGETSAPPATPVVVSGTPSATIVTIVSTTLTPAATATATATNSPRGATTATPSDQPATAAIVGQIQRSVRELTSCGNAGELLSVWAFFTDDFVTEAASKGGVLFNRTILTARVQAAVDRQDAMPTVSDVRSREDGRVSAQVTVPIGSPFSVITGQTGSVTCEWIQVSGQWRIDRVVAGDGTGGP